MSDPAPKYEAGERTWEQGWEEHERLQRDRLSRLSLPEKLAWLEEAHRVVRNLREGKDRGSQSGAGGGDVRR